MADWRRSPRRLKAAPYLGEISALAFLPLPPRLFSFPLLLAGTGSQLLVYDLESAGLLNSFQVFEGVRVHGMSLPPPDQENAFLIAVFGERKVKLFRLRIDMVSIGGGKKLGLELVGRLPGFDHWVLDACFLKAEGILAVGLSDNSVALWDLRSSVVVSRVKSQERCLLYSMRMWVDSIDTFQVASGTINNEIIVWKLMLQNSIPPSTLLMESLKPSRPGYENTETHDQQYVAVHLSRLAGHEGSIFRIAWSSDGSKLMSVSDDRSARIWTISGQRRDYSDLGDIHGRHVPANLTLFGHNARIWDCYISDSIAITVGEDCTCRVWGMDGSQFMMFKEHIGRGIWRCLYDPCSSLLVTAGFDSAIRVHELQSSSSGETREQNGVLLVHDLKDRTEIFTICPPKMSKQIDLMDSRSEFVRCLRFAHEDILYVATNNGFFHRAELSNPGDVRWTELAQVGEVKPIICMDILFSPSEFSPGWQDIVAIGDGEGNVTVLKLINSDLISKVASCASWPAEKERQLVGVYWCKSLGCNHLFTADPRGSLKLWRIDDTLQSDAHDSTIKPKASLIAMFTSSFGARIMSVDASIKAEILICGDKRGNLIAFPLTKGLTMSNSGVTVENIPLVDCFKGAHGISCVNSIHILTFDSALVEIHTTGGDGCICYFKYDKTLQKLEFTGMKQVKELSTIQSVFTNSNPEDLALGNYAVGFTSTDFILWDLTNETKTVQIPCGGWRRPYSYHIGTVPEYQYCFSYLKDHTIHIHRLWVPSQGRKLFPQVPHVQFHGREIHSLCFISIGLQSIPKNNCYLWIATGCEDGTVRLTRYSPSKMGGWSASKLLGEHVGGSAVRSICFVPKLYTYGGKIHDAQGKDTCLTSMDSKDGPVLLISVGSKQVLTSWLLQNGMPDDEKAPLDGMLSESEHMTGLYRNEFSSISFQWLSTHMPPKFASSQRRVEKLLEMSVEGNSSTMPVPQACAHLTECTKQMTKAAFIHQMENDWRYLAVTAFLLRHTDSRLTVCFIVVASSDATLMLRALLLPCRLWFDVALLAPQTSPVLALQHLVVTEHSDCKDAVQTGNAYIVVSGSTDGSITFWNLTETVESFMQLVLEVQPQMLIDYQRRPRTGRGSQGGRWWKSLTDKSNEKSVVNSCCRVRSHSDFCDQGTDDTAFEASYMRESDSVSESCPKTRSSMSFHKPEELSSILPGELREIRPLHTVNSVHQSGVNCLHVSEIKYCLHSKSETAYCIISGGDDQSLHCLGFNLTMPMKNLDCGYSQLNHITSHTEDETLRRQSGSNFIREYCHLTPNNGNKLAILFQDRIASAHSSAVKGVWTDGMWAFSTGLDQRIRCWRIHPSGKLAEDAHIIISVPEPEALDARLCDSSSGRYQIAVAGRGMQMVEFCASLDED